VQAIGREREGGREREKERERRRVRDSEKEREETDERECERAREGMCVCVRERVQGPWKQHQQSLEEPCLLTSMPM